MTGTCTTDIAPEEAATLAGEWFERYGAAAAADHRS